MKCNYPNCKVKAAKTWALVPLCEGHHETIDTETDKYYTGRKQSNSKVEHEIREHYFQICHLIPWSKMCLEYKNKDKMEGDAT